MNEQFSFWSSVNPELLKKVLLQGTFLAGCGVTTLVAASIFLPKNLLETWGIILFLLASALMAVGLVPYRRLQKLASKPDKITLSDDEHLNYYRDDRLIESISFNEIQAIEWVEKSNIYGILIHLKNGKAKLFPFFSKRSYQEIHEIILLDN